MSSRPTTLNRRSWTFPPNILSKCSNKEGFIWIARWKSVFWSKAVVLSRNSSGSRCSRIVSSIAKSETSIATRAGPKPPNVVLSKSICLFPSSLSFKADATRSRSPLFTASRNQFMPCILWTKEKENIRQVEKSHRVQETYKIWQLPFEALQKNTKTRKGQNLYACIYVFKNMSQTRRLWTLWSFILSCEHKEEAAKWNFVACTPGNLNPHMCFVWTHIFKRTSWTMHQCQKKTCCANEKGSHFHVQFVHEQGWNSLMMETSPHIVLVHIWTIDKNISNVQKTMINTSGKREVDLKHVKTILVWNMFSWESSQRNKMLKVPTKILSVPNLRSLSVCRFP